MNKVIPATHEPRQTRSDSISAHAQEHVECKRASVDDARQRKIDDATAE